MNKEEFASDSDQSDDDYCPGQGQDTDILSEEETDDEIDEKSLNSNKTTKKQNGRKRSKKRQIKKSKITPESSSSNQKFSEPDNNIQKSTENEESEKARADALWADFLGDTKTETKSKTLETNSKPIEKMKITEVFDFAGEEVKITKEIQINELEKNIPEKVPPTTRNSTTTSSRIPLKRPASGGLSSVLGQIGKKNKISVLEKTKLDWDHFKKEKNLNEELKTFNKGKDGYLERQDFLQRTDVRQFEIEKTLRQTKRSSNR